MPTPAPTVHSLLARHPSDQKGHGAITARALVRCLTGILLLAACDRASGPPPAAEPAPAAVRPAAELEPVIQALLTDKDNGFGTKGFSWLPPVVATAPALAVTNFDGTAAVTVTVQLVNADRTGTQVATFSGTQITVSTTANANFPNTP